MNHLNTNTTIMDMDMEAKITTVEVQVCQGMGT